MICFICCRNIKRIAASRAAGAARHLRALTVVLNLVYNMSFSMCLVFRYYSV